MTKDNTQWSNRDILIRTIRVIQMNMGQSIQSVADFDNFTDKELQIMADAKAQEQTDWLKQQRDSQKTGK